ncbi:MAG: ParA family protein, partial [Acidimicrobiales bacterium]
MTTAIALFNNKGGVGKTTLTYHLANMVARLGWRVLAVDLDPQANHAARVATLLANTWAARGPRIHRRARWCNAADGLRRTAARSAPR